MNNRNKKSIEKLEYLKAKLNAGQKNIAWVDEACTYIKLYLGKCEECKTMRKLEFRTDPMVYSLTQFNRLADEAKMANKLLDSCLIRIKEYGIIKLPKINIFQRFSDGAIATILVAVLGAAFGFGYWMGKIEYQNNGKSSAFSKTQQTNVQFKDTSNYKISK